MIYKYYIYIVNIFQEFCPVTSISVYITPIIDIIEALKINKWIIKYKSTSILINIYTCSKGSKVLVAVN